MPSLRVSSPTSRAMHAGTYAATLALATVAGLFAGVLLAVAAALISPSSVFYAGPHPATHSALPYPAGFDPAPSYTRA